MASQDPAFQWESEVLRSSGRKRSPGGVPAGSAGHDSGEWLTVREASEATGIPTSTIRKWARHDNIPSFLEETDNGYLRLVSMEGIDRWTEEIGREVDPPPPSAEVDLTAVEEKAQDPGPTPEQAAPEGTMIVPLDAWNRMLNQLGNLHEAGQQLAEARERAAKAETESQFLKERLADLREELEKTRRTETEKAEEPSHQPSPQPPSTISLARKIYNGWRSKRRNRR
ncbi:MAG: helix-turn-helix domain-containing protein [Actinomycetota bacterium]